MNMFRQAKVLDHECFAKRDQYFVVRNSRLPSRPTGPSEEQTLSMDVSPGDVFRCRENLVTREIVGETIIVPITGELADLQQVYSLNATGAFVWGRLDGSASLESIHKALTAHFKVGKKAAWSDLAELVADLSRAGLIEEVR
jgi:hypothetical protein